MGNQQHNNSNNNNSRRPPEDCSFCVHIETNSYRKIEGYKLWCRPPQRPNNNNNNNEVHEKCIFQKCQRRIRNGTSYNHNLLRRGRRDDHDEDIFVVGLVAMSSPRSTATLPVEVMTRKYTRCSSSSSVSCRDVVVVGSLSFRPYHNCTCIVSPTMTGCVNLASMCFHSEDGWLFCR